jgi:hypothetical protein
MDYTFVIRNHGPLLLRRKLGWFALDEEVIAFLFLFFKSWIMKVKLIEAVTELVGLKKTFLELNVIFQGLLVDLKVYLRLLEELLQIEITFVAVEEVIWQEFNRRLKTLGSILLV